MLLFGTYTWHFANGVVALRMPAYFNPYPDEYNLRSKDWGLQPFYLDADFTITPFLTLALSILPKIKQFFTSNINDLLEQIMNDRYNRIIIALLYIQ